VVGDLQVLLDEFEEGLAVSLICLWVDVVQADLYEQRIVNSSCSRVRSGDGTGDAEYRTYNREHECGVKGGVPRHILVVLVHHTDVLQMPLESLCSKLSTLNGI
jgi:hypothetical protein